MPRSLRIILAIGCGLLAAQLALAQSASTTGQAQAATGSGSVNASADASAQADARRLRETIETRAAKVPAGSRTRAEQQLDVTANEVDQDASGHGESVVAARLAAEFGMTTDAILAEKQALGASWGQLMIAHTLAANATSGVTVERLLSMHTDGMGWGKIAAGLGFNLGSVVSSVNSEGRVATGRAKADGHVSAMRGAGVRPGVGAGIKAGAGARAGGVGAHAGVGAGVKIGH